MDTLKAAALGFSGGLLVGRLLGIGPLGTALGGFAGIVAGVLLGPARRAPGG